MAKVELKAGMAAYKQELTTLRDLLWPQKITFLFKVLRKCAELYGGTAFISNVWCLVVNQGSLLLQIWNPWEQKSILEWKTQMRGNTGIILISVIL